MDFATVLNSRCSSLLTEVTVVAVVQTPRESLILWFVLQHEVVIESDQPNAHFKCSTDLGGALIILMCTIHKQ